MNNLVVSYNYFEWKPVEKKGKVKNMHIYESFLLFGTFKK